MTVTDAVLTEGMRYLARSAENYIFISRKRTHTRISRARMQGYYDETLDRLFIRPSFWTTYLERIVYKPPPQTTMVVL
jgi:hypothetical protein